MPTFSNAFALMIALLSFVAAWQPNHGCPEAIHVKIPNNSEHVTEGQRYGMIWDEHDNIGSGIATMVDVHAVLLSCPDIRSLDVHPRYRGCVEFPDRWNIPWSLDGSDQIPPLEDITLTDYDFDQREWDRIAPPQELTHPTVLDTAKSWLAPWKVWFHSGNAEKWFDIRDLPEEQRRKSNLDLWLDQMDWTKLKSLTIINEHDAPKGKALYERLPQMVPGLESLTVKGPWMEEADTSGHVLEVGNGGPEGVRRAKDFILAFPENSIKNLSWLKSGVHNTAEYLDVLKHHGHGLSSFEWRDAEDDFERRPVFTSSQLREISKLTPNLKSLAIDLNRNGSWPYEELTTIAEHFPSLTNLTLYLEITSDCYRGKDYDDKDNICSDDDCYGWENFEKPLLDLKEAEQLFDFLHGKKVGGQLKSVKFRHGDWEPRRLLEFLELDTFLNQKKSHMDCERSRSVSHGQDMTGRACQGLETDLSSWEKARLERCDGEKRERLHDRDEL